MGRLFVLVLLPALVLWTTAAWWKMRRAKSTREKSFLARASLGVWLLIVVFSGAFCMVPAKMHLLLVGAAVVSTFAVKKLWGTVHKRIRHEESDPLFHAKRVN